MHKNFPHKPISSITFSSLLRSSQDMQSFSSDLKMIQQLIFNQYRGCLLVKNSFVNISEVNRQCLHSLGTRSEDDFEKVSSTRRYAEGLKYRYKLNSLAKIKSLGKQVKHRHRRNVMSYRFKSLLKLFSLLSLFSLFSLFSLL